MLTLFRIATGDNWNGILEVSEYKKNIEILWDRHLDNLLNSNSIYSQLYLAILLYARCYASSETQGQIVWARESLNGREIWHEEK